MRQLGSDLVFARRRASRFPRSSWVRALKEAKLEDFKNETGAMPSEWTSSSTISEVANG